MASYTSIKSIFPSMEVSLRSSFQKSARKYMVLEFIIYEH